MGVIIGGILFVAPFVLGIAWVVITLTNDKKEGQCMKKWNTKKYNKRTREKQQKKQALARMKKEILSVFGLM